jgi:muramidase (phage lysozyme)
MEFKKKYFFLKKYFLCFLIQSCFCGGSLDQSKINMILQYMVDRDIRCFLNIISLCEGTSKQKKASICSFKPSWNEYSVSFGYTEKINLKKYPELYFLPRGKKYLSSTACGRYQFIVKTWKYLIQRYNQIKIFNQNKDFFIDFFNNIEIYYDDTVVEKYRNIDDLLHFKFGPFWQDFYAVVLLMQANLIGLIKNKNIEKICQKISFIWPSFPKNKLSENRYKDGVNNAKSFKKIVRLFELQMKKREE